jgi:hypothetical protein
MNEYEIESFSASGNIYNIQDEHRQHQKQIKEILDTVTHSDLDDRLVFVITKNNKHYTIKIELNNKPEDIVIFHTDNDDLQRVIGEYKDFWCGEELT